MNHLLNFRVADPHPYPVFHFNAYLDPHPNPVFHLNADPDLTLDRGDGNLRPLIGLKTFQGAILSLQTFTSESLRLSTSLF